MLSSAPVESSQAPWPQISSRLTRLAQPVEVIAAEVRDVVGRVVEVHRVATLNRLLAIRHDRHVVDAAVADREGEEIGAPEREVRSVVGAEADAGDGDLGVVARIGADERHDLVHDPVLVAPVLLRALLQREPVAVPAAGVVAVDGVDLHAPGLDQIADRIDHPALFVLPRRALLRGEREQRPTPVAVGEDACLGADRG